MNIKLGFASILTLGVLSGMVISIILAIAYFMGFILWHYMIIGIIVWNALMWLISPYISNFIYKWLYKVKFYDYEDIKDKPYAQFLKKVCDEHKMKFPKIGIIPDNNPTAFTYGSAAFNARIVLTDGLFKFLNEEEVNAVVAHEAGHIVNKDFIIMTIAATLLEVLYEIYVIFSRTRYQSSSSKALLGKKAEKKGDILVLIGYVSYIFYLIGTYILLFLSRIREYYADEFSAKQTKNPNALSSALIKIAYGIAAVPDTEKTAHLLNNTRAQGIFDFKSAKEMGLVCLNSKSNKALLENSLLYDHVNPWAAWFELSSTHPLNGKRIRRLCSLTPSPLFDFDKLLQTKVDKKRLRNDFFAGFIIQHSVMLSFIVFIAAIIIEALIMKQRTFLMPTMIAFIVITLSLAIIRLKYKFPKKGFSQSSVLECMGDLYASPVRGRPVILSGKAIGRGEAGYVFGEDMIFQDNTGIIYLNYESAVPIFGNFFFAWKKLEKILQKPAEATGWFFRGATHHIELNEFTTADKKIKSYVYAWSIVGIIVLMIALSLFSIFVIGLNVILAGG